MTILGGLRLIQGDSGTEAPAYGRSAYRNAHKSEQETLQQLRDHKDLSSLVQTIRTAAISVRYTPENTVNNGHLSEEGKKNLLGFADEFIETHDKNADHALGHSDFYERIGPMTQWDIDRIDYELANPKLSEDKREKFEETKKQKLDTLNKQAASIVEFMDLPDSHGKTDGLVQRDEAAAYFLTQDGLLDALKKNYGLIKSEHQKKYPDESWGWFQFKIGAGIAIMQLASRLLGREQPFKMDGRISGAESFTSSLWSTLLPETNRDAIIQNYRDHELSQFKP